MGNKDQPSRLYSKELNLQFYHIPKNAMTSTIRGLKLEWTNPVPSSTRPRAYAERVRTLRTLAILRDPLKRFISSFKYILFLRTHPRNDYNSDVRPILGQTRFNHSGNGTPFYLQTPEHYLKELEVGGFFDSHNLPQAWWLDEKYRGDCRALASNKSVETHLRHFKGRKISQVTHFVKFEALNAELNRIAGNTYTIPHMNQAISRGVFLGRGNTSENLEKFVEDNRNRIETLYADDVKLYKKFILDKSPKI